MLTAFLSRIPQSEVSLVVVLGIFATIVVSLASLVTLSSIFRMFVRHKNIAKAGWPPPYVDADGDMVPTDGTWTTTETAE